MKTKLFIVIICLFSFGCKEEEHKDKLLFIQEILKNPTEIENIIKSSSFYDAELTKINFEVWKEDLINYPVNLDSIEIRIDEPDKLDADGFFDLYFTIIEAKYQISYLSFTFIKINNVDWKLRRINYLVGYPNR